MLIYFRLSVHSFVSGVFNFQCSLLFFMCSLFVFSLYLFCAFYNIHLPLWFFIFVLIFLSYLFNIFHFSISSPDRSLMLLLPLRFYAVSIKPPNKLDAIVFVNWPGIRAPPNPYIRDIVRKLGFQSLWIPCEND